MLSAISCISAANSFIRGVIISNVRLGMSRKIPPLNAVRSFEAAARHLSFTHAGNELNVTQAAISHQIKTLEQWLGMPLFRRLNRAVSLTEEGAAYLPAAS